MDDAEATEPALPEPTDPTEVTEPTEAGPTGDGPTGDAPTGDAPTGAEPTEGGPRELSPSGAGPVVADLEHEGEIAADYLEGLLDILDLDGDLDLDVEGERASVAIVGEGLGNLVGPAGATLEALQELTRLAVLQQTGERSRLMLDIGGFRARRRADLERLAGEVAERVRTGGEPERLAPMSPFERKVVHDAIALTGGLVSESEGEEPQRRVVVRPA
ncbi:MAG TPA: R3H domain-containing nucleic acid-binding protein [Mycobacteriales bacterium]|nr:R3H domain-containing nucleic acid-binding protein [Mycobacteriales bacterium]